MSEPGSRNGGVRTEELGWRAVEVESANTYMMKLLAELQTPACCREQKISLIEATSAKGLGRVKTLA